MNANPTQVCPKCYYDGNPDTATHCDICKQPLKPENVLSSNSNTILWLVPLIALLLLLAGVGYFFWRKDAVSPKTVGNPSSPIAKSPQAPPLASANNSHSSDIKLYNSMREVQNVPRGLFNYGGAHTFAALSSHGMNSAIALAHPEFRLRYTEPLNNKPGSGTGIAMLLDGKLSFSQSGRPLEDAEYSKARTYGFNLQQVPIAIDGITFYTHSDIPVDGLSVDQVQAIFMGKVTNWKQVGGPDLPVRPFSVDPKITSSIQILFEGVQGASLGRNVQLVRDYTEAIRNVASTPGGISYGSAPLAKGQQTILPLSLAKANSNQYVKPFTENNQVNAEAFRDGTYPLTRRLFVVIRRDRTPDEQAGVAYVNLLLSKEGQQLIEKAGFVSIYQ